MPPGTRGRSQMSFVLLPLALPTPHASRRCFCPCPCLPFADGTPLCSYLIGVFFFLQRLCISLIHRDCSLLLHFFFIVSVVCLHPSVSQSFTSTLTQDSAANTSKERRRDASLAQEGVNRQPDRQARGESRGQGYINNTTIIIINISSGFATTPDTKRDDQV